MTLTTREVDNLSALLRKIRGEARNPKKNKIENMCDKAARLLSKASRRQTRPVRLVFETNDFEL